MATKKPIKKPTKTKYLQMPVSFEEKREWNRKGYKVVDKRFDPNPEKPKRKPKKETATEGSED